MLINLIIANYLDNSDIVSIFGLNIINDIDNNQLSYIILFNIMFTTLAISKFASITSLANTNTTCTTKKNKRYINLICIYLLLITN